MDCSDNGLHLCGAKPLKASMLIYRQLIPHKQQHPLENVVCQISAVLIRPPFVMLAIGVRYWLVAYYLGQDYPGLIRSPSLEYYLRSTVQTQGTDYATCTANCDAGQLSEERIMWCGDKNCVQENAMHLGCDQVLWTMLMENDNFQSCFSFIYLFIIIIIIFFK